MKPTQSLLQDPKLQRKFEAVQAAADQHDLFLEEHRGELSPAEALPELRRKIEHADPKTAVELAKQVEALCSPAAAQISVSHRREASRLYEIFKTQAVEFLTVCLPKLETLKSEAIESERKFFAEHGLPRSETAVTRQVSGEITNCRAHLDGLRRPRGNQGLARAGRAGLFGWLGVTD